MRERLEERLRELEAEFERGERTLAELEAQVASTRQTLLRMSGAIQVLREELGEDQPRQDGAGPAVGGEPTVAGSQSSGASNDR